jgi:glutamate synthase domain-containing protein 1
MEALLGTLAGMAESGVRAGDLSEADGRAVLEYTERLYRELYMGYTEFKESDMIVKGMLLTYSEEVALKTRREDAKRYREEKKKVIEKTRLETERETAKKMKGLNLPADQIVFVSGLSPDEIAKL